jgi:hypothetical protein
MIEFKASCGHTVRARDEDAGRRVRCSYCGRAATVPDAETGSLDFLLEETDDASVGPEDEARKKRRRLLGRSTRSGRPSDPVATIFRMCYATALLIIAIVVVRKFVFPLFEDDGLARRVATIARGAGGASEDAPEPEPTIRNTGHTMGLLGFQDRHGLYLASTPPGATAFVVDASDAPPTGRINLTPGCTQERADGRFAPVGDGTYVVEMVLPWNHLSLADRDLPYYEQYRAFRRALEDAPPAARLRLLEEYFVPDEADAVFIDEVDDRTFFVRQYRDVKVWKRKSPGVRALFLPRIRPGGRDTFSIVPLVTDYMPKTVSYAFDEEQARVELDLYEVPECDHRFVIEALARIGLIPYVTPDGRTRLFRIGINDGMVVTKIIRDASQ